MPQNVKSKTPTPRPCYSQMCPWVGLMFKALLFAIGIIIFASHSYVLANMVDVVDFSGPGLGEVENVNTGSPTQADQNFWFADGFELGHPTRTLDGRIGMDILFD